MDLHQFFAHAYIFELERQQCQRVFSEEMRGHVQYGCLNSVRQKIYSQQFLLFVFIWCTYLLNKSVKCIHIVVLYTCSSILSVHYVFLVLNKSIYNYLWDARQDCLIEMPLPWHYISTICSLLSSFMIWTKNTS